MCNREFLRKCAEWLETLAEGNPYFWIELQQKIGRVRRAGGSIEPHKPWFLWRTRKCKSHQQPKKRPFRRTRRKRRRPVTLRDRRKWSIRTAEAHVCSIMYFRRPSVGTAGAPIILIASLPSPVESIFTTAVATSARQSRTAQSVETGGKHRTLTVQDIAIKAPTRRQDRHHRAAAPDSATKGPNRLFMLSRTTVFFFFLATVRLFLFYIFLIPDECFFYDTSFFSLFRSLCSSPIIICFIFMLSSVICYFC